MEVLRYQFRAIDLSPERSRLQLDFQLSPQEQIRLATLQRQKFHAEPRGVTERACPHAVPMTYCNRLLTLGVE